MGISDSKTIKKLSEKTDVFLSDWIGQHLNFSRMAEFIVRDESFAAIVKAFLFLIVLIGAHLLSYFYAHEKLLEIHFAFSFDELSFSDLQMVMSNTDWSLFLIVGFPLAIDLVNHWLLKNMWFSDDVRKGFVFWIQLLFIGMSSYLLSYAFAESHFLPIVISFIFFLIMQLVDGVFQTVNMNSEIEITDINLPAFLIQSGFLLALVFFNINLLNAHFSNSFLVDEEANLSGQDLYVCDQDSNSFSTENELVRHSRFLSSLHSLVAPSEVDEEKINCYGLTPFMHNTIHSICNNSKDVAIDNGGEFFQNGLMIKGTQDSVIVMTKTGSLYSTTRYMLDSIRSIKYSIRSDRDEVSQALAYCDLISKRW